jgi:hypothetical protein
MYARRRDAVVQAFRLRVLCADRDVVFPPMTIRNREPGIDRRDQ